MIKIRRFLDNNSMDLKLEAESEKYEKTLKLFAFGSWVLLLIAQVVMIFKFNGTQVSDAGLYIDFAFQAIRENSIYPSLTNSHDHFIFGNGYVNLLALIFRLINDIKAVYFVNIFFTQLLLFSCTFILKKITKSKTASYWFVIFFSLLTTFWSETVQTRTEIVFTAIAFFAVAIAYGNKKSKYIFVGIVLALANWVRPLGIAFLLGMIIKLFCEKEKLRGYFKLLSGYVITIVLIGTITFSQCGVFIYQATTLGYNLIMSANDKADGSYMNVHAEGEVAYISPEREKEMYFTDFDDYYVDLSVEWIKENPGKYISQFPKKLFYLLATETYSGTVFFDNKVSTGGLDYFKGLLNKFKGNDSFAFGDILIIFTQIWYMLILALFLFSIFILIKKKAIVKFTPIGLILVCGIGISLLAVGSARYHFPYLPMFMMGAAISMQFIVGKIQNKKSLSNCEKNWQKR